MSSGLCHMQIFHPKPCRENPRTPFSFGGVSAVYKRDPAILLGIFLTHGQQKTGMPFLDHLSIFPLRVWDAQRISPQHCCHH